MTAIETKPRLMPSRPAPAPAPAQPDHDHPAFLAHHFDAPTQQFDAAKLGMFLFLATEVLLFGGLFCLYAVYRGNHPEIFAYGSQFLDTRWGATNTAILLISSMTMAIAVTAAQRGQKRLLLAMLLVTFLGGAMFMGIKYIEYHHKFEEKLLWGDSYYQKPAWLVAQEQFERWQAERAMASAPAFEPDVDTGIALWMATCRSCHGVKGEGVAGQGIDQRGSAFIASKSDAELAQFIAAGRPPNDPSNKTGLQMPPRGGNPLLSDADLRHIVAYVRTFDPAPAPAAVAGAAAAGQPGAPAGESATPPGPVEITRSVIPDARQGPEGMSLGTLVQEERRRELVDRAPGMEIDHAALQEQPHHAVDPTRPVDAHLFFSIYYLMTGLHGIHVLGGMGMIAWLTILTIRNRFSADYFTPVDLGGLYWHIVDIIWIFLFPLFYLIGS